MKDQNYSIRLSEKMKDFIVKKSREMQLLPSEYVRYLLQKEMEKEKF